MSNVIDLSSRQLGSCPVCRQPVVFQDNFVRLGGFVLHIRCAVERRARLVPDRQNGPRPA
jgi:hypothetical protein